MWDVFHEIGLEMEYIIVPTFYWPVVGHMILPDCRGVWEM
jgi:hypothetical protein